MKKGATIILQGAVVLAGLASLAFMLWEPHLEGRNAHATLFEIYFQDPFLAYAYTASIPFFMALYQAFRMLGYMRLNGEFSPEVSRALRTIKHCAFYIVGFVAVSVVFMPFSDPDDRPPGIVLRILITLVAIAIAAVAAMCERVFRRAADIKFSGPGRERVSGRGSSPHRLLHL